MTVRDDADIAEKLGLPGVIIRHTSMRYGRISAAIDDLTLLFSLAKLAEVRLIMPEYGGKTLSGSISGSKAGLRVGTDVVAAELLVKFQPGVTVEQQQALHVAHGATVVTHNATLRVDRLRVQGDAAQVLAAYRASSLVEWAQPNELQRLHNLPSTGQTTDAQERVNPKRQ